MKTNLCKIDNKTYMRLCMHHGQTIIQSGRKLVMLSAMGDAGDCEICGDTDPGMAAVNNTRVRRGFVPLTKEEFEG